MDQSDCSTIDLARLQEISANSSNHIDNIEGSVFISTPSTQTIMVTQLLCVMLRAEGA